MAHVRKQARDQAIAALLGATDAGAQVESSARTDNWPKGFGAGIRVSTPEEESGVGSAGNPATLARQITLRVAGWREGGDDLDDLLDQLATQIELAIYGTGRLGGLALEVTLGATGPVIDGDGVKRAGTIALDFRVLVATPENDPETAI